VWDRTFGDQSTVTVHVRRSREKIEQDPADPRLIVTVWVLATAVSYLALTFLVALGGSLLVAVPGAALLSRARGAGRRARRGVRDVDEGCRLVVRLPVRRSRSREGERQLDAVERRAARAATLARQRGDRVHQQVAQAGGVLAEDAEHLLLRDTVVALHAGVEVGH
jgi:hypothetical protein